MPRHFASAGCVVTALLVSVVATGCGSHPSATPVAAIAPSALPAGVTHLTSRTKAHDVLVSWTPAAGHVDGYAIYLDSRRPIMVSAAAVHERFNNLAPGAHFIQLVTKDGTNVSDPVATTAHVRHPRIAAVSANLVDPGTSTVLPSAPQPPSSASTGAVSGATTSSRSLTGTLEVVEAVDVGDPSENPKSCMSLNLQFVLSNGSSDALGVSGDPEFHAMTHKSKDKNAFIADCAYSYTISNVPQLSLYKLTITGDLTDTTFTGIDPVQGEFVTASQVAGGTLPQIIGNISIGV
jgi:hypothetical protein